MTEKELLYYVALQKAKGIGAVLAKRLIKTAGSAEAVFKTPENRLGKTFGISSKILSALHDKTLLEKAEKEVEYILYHRIRFTGFTDEAYPKRLLETHDAPILLFSKGNIVWDDRPAIGIVGTRKMTAYGKRFIERFIKDISPYNPVIISGFAYGVDITAHLEAMHHGLQTIAVMAHGIDQTYPHPHRTYVERVLENGGFYTEFHHDELPLRENFISRNRIVAGMSDAVIVVESAKKGGALITADMAFSYGREVFAVPGRFDDIWSEGCNMLIRNNKAAILNNANDLVYYLNWSNRTDSKKPKAVQTRMSFDLEGEEKTVYDYLKEKGKSLLDTISVETGIPVYKLSGILLNMELQGVVNPLPGKFFEVNG